MAKEPDPTPAELRERMEADIKAFLDSGKKIQQIPIGVSGVDATKGNKNIALGSARKRQGS